jgi:uncharacterized protein
MNIESQASLLIDFIRPLESCVVALSGGVDSAVVCQAAKFALGDRCLAATAISPSVASLEQQHATQIAQLVGIRHELVFTAEINDPDYVRNDSQRCYHCKSELYAHIGSRMATWQMQTILNGANRDDLGDYRPGMKAAAEHRVISPLLECGFDKNTVREIAKFWNLPIHNKPASPCLASRIAYGESVTVERLRMIEQAETCLRTLGFRELRVRYHRGDLARIEVPTSEIPRLLESELRLKVVEQLNSFGFQSVTIDLQGFRSGNLNQLIPIDVLRANVPVPAQQIRAESAETFGAGKNSGSSIQ